jgi:hypothetical protein
VVSFTHKPLYLWGKNFPSNHWIIGGLDPRGDLDMMAKIKFPASARNQTVVIWSIVSLLTELFLLLKDIK